MSLVTDILTYDQIQDLWGAGYTITRRNRDPFEIDPKLIPHGVSYQWNPIQNVDPNVKQPEGWTPVPFSRHEGVFAPWGMAGDIYRDGLHLCEKPKEMVDAARAEQVKRAGRQVDDWAAKTASHGITGEVNVGGQNRQIGNPSPTPPGAVILDGTKTIETIVAIPREMTPHIASIFKERDRLEAEVVRKDRTLVPGPIADKFHEAIVANERDTTAFQWWPTLRAILLPIAVENVRNAMKAAGAAEEKTDE